MVPVTTRDLKSVIALQDLPEEHLQWIIDHSEYREYDDGEIIGKYGEPAEVMWISLQGKVVFYMYINGHQVYYFTFENNNITGGIGGLMPYSRMKTYPGYSYAQGKVILLRMHKKHFAELERLNADFIQKLIGYMTERAKAFATTRLQHEKMSALGKLAAGIAHELNNPAAAIRGISEELGNRLNRNYELTKKMLSCNMKAEHLQKIHQLVEAKKSLQATNTRRSVLQLMDNEDELADWLETYGINERETAETFSEFGFSTDELEHIHTGLDDETFARVISWLENLISSQKVIKDLDEASGRISYLVSSIKSHVQMDKNNDLQPTDVNHDIENSLVLLGFKLRAKNIEVRKNFSGDLPLVPAYVGELNQVWTNLIDNAIYAMDKNGVLTIETSSDEKDVMVSVIDNGVGIPGDVLSHIFDPFFTTKKTGDGTGIGLDLVDRIIKQHAGTIKVKSVPGRTEFAVCIPTIPKAAHTP